MANRNSETIYNELTTPYPRLCAHRGFSTAALENSMAAFLAALELGAQEIEFDLWETADGQVVSCHDSTLDRCSKIQFHKACMTEEMIRKAHDHGIRCNVYWSDDAEETARFLAMGVDTILSNNCAAVLPAFGR